MPWLDSATAKQDIVFPFGQAADHHFRVLVMNGMTMVADEPRHAVAVGDTKADSFAAMAAKIHEKGEETDAAL